MDPKEINGPLVSVMIPTYNRRRYLPIALASVLNQTYRNIEVFVVRDGGEDIADVIGQFADCRIKFINRSQNRGKPYSLNEALAQASGKYVCYLDDDDMYYPQHVATLVDALESQDQCQAAYSDLYKAHCRVAPDGTRTVLSKIVEISRDFDRFFLLHFNHVLHVSLMHRRDLLEKTGPYNENLQVLIDWDMVRRLAFFTDFLHVPKITGEFYGPVEDCDRISVVQRKDEAKYLRNILLIRTSRPSKPWPKMQSVSIIYLPQSFGSDEAAFITMTYRLTFCVFDFIIPVHEHLESGVNISMPNCIRLRVAANSNIQQCLDAAIARCDSEYVAIVPSGITPELFWLEDPLSALMASKLPNDALFLNPKKGFAGGVILRKDELASARMRFADLDIEQSLASAGINVREVAWEELPFKFDDFLEQARRAAQDGDYEKAGSMFEKIGEKYGNALWMNTLAAEAYDKGGFGKKALELSSQINQIRPTVNTLLSQAKLHRMQNEFDQAICLLNTAKDTLEGSELAWK